MFANIIFCTPPLFNLLYFCPSPRQKCWIFSLIKQPKMTHYFSINYRWIPYLVPGAILFF